MSAHRRADVAAGSNPGFGGTCHDAFFGLHRLLCAVIDVREEAIRHDQRVSGIGVELPLSVESALSVRSAAIAIRYHGVRYLPVVDDGRLVGIVAFPEAGALARMAIPPRVGHATRRRSHQTRGQGTTTHLPEDRSPSSFRHADAATTAVSLPAQEFPVRIPARDLAAGDVLHINDWQLHVINIELDQAIGVLTAEFDFLIHFAPEDIVQVHARAQAA